MTGVKQPVRTDGLEHERDKKGNERFALRLVGDEFFDSLGHEGENAPIFSRVFDEHLAIEWHAVLLALFQEVPRALFERHQLHHAHEHVGGVVGQHALEQRVLVVLVDAVAANQILQALVRGLQEEEGRHERQKALDRLVQSSVSLAGLTLAVQLRVARTRELECAKG